MKVFFTESESNLSPEEAEKLGVNLIKKFYVYKGEARPIEHSIVESEIDEKQITTTDCSMDEYKEYFAPYLGNEIVFVAHHRKITSALENLEGQNIPDLTIIETGFLGPAMIEVLKRIMDDKPYDDIRCFMVLKNPEKKARFMTTEKYNLIEVKNGEFKVIKACESKYAAVQLLKKHVNQPLIYGKDLNIGLRLHLGREFVGGIWKDNSI